jgi:signal transduction histidine kinase
LTPVQPEARTRSKETTKIETSEHTDLNRIIGWFISLRWVASGGVLVTLFIVDFQLGYPLPYPILYALTGLLALLNLLFSLYFYVLRKRDLSRGEQAVVLNVQIVCDYIFLFFLVYLTGFLENPFAYFFVFHIMLTAYIFTADVVFVYVSVLIALFIGVSFAEFFRLIPHYSLAGGVDPAYFGLYLPRAAGLIGTLVISAYLMTSIKRRIAERGRRVEVELNRYKELDKIKSNFILQVTHELRGPLAAMNGYHEMLLRGIGGELGEKSSGLIRKANRRTDNLLTIIDEMIDYAYMKSEEEVRLTSTELRLAEIITVNLELAAGAAEQKDIRLVSSCPEGLVFSSNRDLLNIILGNLINNAIKYSPPGTTVAVNAAVTGTDVHLTVRDEGYGIEPKELDNIFEEFYRTRRARELERDGTGLGLPIVKRAVESLGGRLTVYSELDKGTTFHIFFPLGKGGTDEQNFDHR